VGKSPLAQSPRLDIQSLQVKNVRNYSSDKPNHDIYSSQIHSMNNSIHNSNNMSYQGYQNSRNMYSYTPNQSYGKIYQSGNINMNPNINSQSRKGYL